VAFTAVCVNVCADVSILCMYVWVFCVCMPVCAECFMRKLCKHSSHSFSRTGNTSAIAFFASKVEFLYLKWIFRYV